MVNIFNQDDIPIEGFKGLFDRGRDEVVPLDHFIDCLNLRFETNEVKMREGMVESITPYPNEIILGGAVRIVRHFFKYAEGLGNVCLLLLNNGKLYGMRNGVTTLLLNIPTMVDFSITATFTRVYITPHTGLHGLTGEKVYYWDGTNVRAAAGVAPTAGSGMAGADAGTGVSEVQTLALGGTPTGGSFDLITPYGATSDMPYNFTKTSIEAALQGDDEIQKIFITGTGVGGTWKASFAGQQSAAIDWNANAAAVETAIGNITTIGAANIDVLSGTGTSIDPWLVQFKGSLAKQPQDLFVLDASGLTGTGVAITVEETQLGRTLFGAGQVTVADTGGGTPWIITFTKKMDFPLLEIENHLTGVAPPTLTIVETVKGEAPGKIEKGKHKFAVSFETETGFITPPGPKIAGVFTPLEYNSPGEKKCLISNIPVGPAGTVARHLIATKYDEEEYFFVPDGRVGNNSTTSWTVDFFDSELVDSADYLFNLLETIPAALKLVKYGSRMVALGFEFPDNSLARISRAGELEAFDSIEGLYIVNQDDQFQLKTAFELRNILYLVKTLGVFATQDNGEEPAYWATAASIDMGVGGEVNSVSELPNTVAGVTKERVLFLDRSGLLVFDGVFHRPELTWKINDRFLLINKDKFHMCQVWDDPINQYIYFNCPYGMEAEAPNYVFHADYSECGSSPEHQNIKWTPWHWETDNPLSISVFDLRGKGRNVFRFSGEKIWRNCSAGHLDENEAILAHIRLPYVIPPSSSGDALNHYAALRLRINGSGNLDVTLYGIDDAPLAIPPFVLISTSPSLEFTRLVNFINERLSIKLSMDTAGEWFKLFRAVVFGKQYGVSRPS